MRRYKYVKFSKSTAKQNPMMIVREYVKLIEEKKKLVKPLYQNRYCISRNVECRIEGHTYIEGIGKVNYIKETVKLDYFKMKEYIKEIKDNQEKLIKEVSNIKLIRKELKNFEDEFNKYIDLQIY